MGTKTKFREEPYLLEIGSAEGMSHLEVTHGSVLNIKNEPIFSPSDDILQSDGDMDCYYDETEIKKEPTYLEDTASEQKSESEVTDDSGIYTRNKKSSVVSSSVCDSNGGTHRDMNEICIKEEPAYFETAVIEVKSEKEDLDYCVNRQNGILEENQEFIIPARLESAGAIVGNYEFGVTSPTALIGNSTEAQTCKFCGKDLILKSGFQMHKSHGMKSKGVCSSCDKSFVQTVHLKAHNVINEVKKSYKCDECEKCFTQKSCWRSHVLIHEGIRPYKCNQCERCFTQKSNLKKHILIHEGRKPYECCYCEKNFTTAFCLKIHKLVHEGRSPYKCDHCGKSFASASYLKHHKFIHEGKKPYKCEHCNKICITSSHLRQHILIHEDKRLHRCNQCEKYFTIKSNLKRHILVHEGKKPYQCNYCEKKFTTAFCLKVHKLVHEGRSPYKCDHCEKNLSSASWLKKHKLRHKGKIPC